MWSENWTSIAILRLHSPPTIVSLSSIARVWLASIWRRRRKGPAFHNKPYDEASGGGADGAWRGDPLLPKNGVSGAPAQMGISRRQNRARRECLRGVGA